ncbi:MAG: hypothetical protein AAGB46_19135 [Verrucomicrobiota bacterium]
MRIEENDAFDIKFFENVIQNNPRDIEALELLGGLYSKYHISKQALRIDRKLSRIRPQDARIRYNLACSLSLLGRKKDAVASLEKALELGYDDFNWLLQDPDLNNLKGYDRFEQLLSQQTIA